MNIRYAERSHGTRSRERARRRWGDDITDWTGKTLAKCAAVAGDRKSWGKWRVVPQPATFSDEDEMTMTTAGLHR